MLQPEHVLAALCSPTALLCSVAALLLLCVAIRSLSSSDPGRRGPPGPWPLPFLGNLAHLDLKRPDWTLTQLSKKYGPVFTIYLGSTKVVVLAGYKTVKEALVGHAEEFGDRSTTPIFYDTNENHGILFANGDSWKELRRFALTTLTDFGMGKRVAEEKILQESCYLNEVIESHGGKPFSTSIPLNNATSNIISSIVYGQRFEYDDPQFIEMVKRSNETIRVAGSAEIQIYNTFPKFTKWIKNRKVILQNQDKAVKDVKELTQKLKETLNPQMCRGIIDCFLVRKQKDEESRVVNSHYNEKNLVFTVTNLFGAGTDTTAATLRWALLLMAKYPQIQERVHQELSAVVGSRPSQVDDRKNMPYTDAVIHEIQRFGNIAPMAIAHKTSRDITFKGYFIKEGTIVFPLLTSVMYDESEWETPYTFNPSHFLDKEGKFVKRDAFMPFSAGRRVCPGEGLAKMELFLFFTSLLQRFRFTPPPGVSEEELDLTPAVGFTLSPTDHKLCAVSRQ